MLPLRNATPDDYGRFITGRTQHNLKQRREFEANLTRMSQLLLEHGGYHHRLVPLIMRELGIRDRTVRKYKLVLEQRGCCPSCGQIMPVAHLEKDTP